MNDIPAEETHKKKSNIIYSCYIQKSRAGENFVPEHTLGYHISGTLETYVDGKTQIFKEGDLRFIRKNRLARFIKQPPAGAAFQSIAIILDQETLRSISTEYNLHMNRPYTGESSILLKQGDLFRNYIDSLTPYLQGPNSTNKALTNLKVREAVMILLDTHPELQDTLFDFSEPGKIDLEAYMTENYKFNVDLNRYAYLTGRSLATFKRDFERIFHSSPNKWLQQQRLKDAYFLIREKGVKVTDVYMDVGFKDLSHFSFAFKKAYGITPSKLKIRLPSDSLGTL